MSSPVSKGGLLKRSKQGEKRLFDVAMNITPMTDVMASILCFLLVSATYVQYAKMDANLPSTGASAALADTPEDEQEKLELQLLLTKSKKIMVDRGNGLEELEVAEGDTFNWAKLDEVLKEIRQQYPDHKDAILSADPDIEYEFVVAAMDVCIANKISNVSLAASAVKGAGE